MREGTKELCGPDSPSLLRYIGKAKCASLSSAKLRQWPQLSNPSCGEVEWFRQEDADVNWKHQEKLREEEGGT